MDIFNSALKNPIPPAMKKEDEKIESEAALKRKKTSRRKHRNSHLGCGTCKKRRIKCDENLPSCVNCLKGKLHCAYLNLDTNARSALRMAQYNQHLRQDRMESDKSPIQSGPNTTNTSPSPNDVLVNNGGPQQGFAVPYPILQTTSTPVNIPQQAHVIQSPYGPLVSLQPMHQLMANLAIPYSQIPVVQSQVPVVYLQGGTHITNMQNMQNGHILQPQPTSTENPPPGASSVPSSAPFQPSSAHIQVPMKDKDIALPPLSSIPQSNIPISLRTSPNLSSNNSVSYNTLPSINNDYSTKSNSGDSLDNSPILPPLKKSTQDTADKNPKISRLLS